MQMDLIAIQPDDPFSILAAEVMSAKIDPAPIPHMALSDEERNAIADATKKAKKLAEVNMKQKKMRTELGDFPGIFVMAPEFDPAENFLDPAIRESFMNVPLFEETDFVTRPENTTNTASGFISNLSFLEEELIKILEPSSEAIVIKCNFGELRYQGYTWQPKKPKSNRGRKKKEKVKKDRKQQGDGKAMNSQITAIMVSPETPVEHIDGAAVFDHANMRTFGIKIFRNGVAQLPGTVFKEIDQVIPCFKKVARMLGKALHPDEIDPEKMCHLVNLNYVMKNFKFALKIPADMRIDLVALRRVLNVRSELFPVTEIKEKIKTDAQKKAQQERKEDLKDFSAENITYKYPPSQYRNLTPCYNCEKIKLSVKFFTPRVKHEEKTTHFNVFRSGKINILGSQDRNATAETAMVLCEIIRANWDVIIYREGEDVLEPYVPADNILDYDEEPFSCKKIREEVKMCDYEWEILADVFMLR